MSDLLKVSEERVKYNAGMGWFKLVLAEIYGSEEF
jgi:hypothetical protein